MSAIFKGTGSKVNGLISKTASKTIIKTVTRQGERCLGRGDVKRPAVQINASGPLAGPRRR
jgi:hypothetical protein